MVWEPFPTVKACCFWGAAFQLAFPAWLASRVQVPVPVKLTAPAEIEQTLELDESTVIVTANPEVAVAVGV